MLEQIACEVPRIQERQNTYQVGNLKSLSATALYYGNNGSGFSGGGFGGISKSDMTKYKIVIPPAANSSDFVPASNLGLGQGIARIDSSGMAERARKDDDLPSHLNYEYWVPGEKTKSGKQKWIELANIHIDLDD